MKSEAYRKISNRFIGLAPRQKLAVLAFSLLLFTGAVFVAAELGGYGISGPDTAPNSLDYGLVGYWNMEEGGGQTVYDKSGNGNDGTLGSSASADATDPAFGGGHDASGATGTSAVFDGTDDYVGIAHQAGSMDSTDDISVSAWIYSDNYAKTYQMIAVRASNDAGSWQLRMNSTSGKPQFCVNAGGQCANSTVSLANGSWYHVVGTYDKTLASANIKIYVDAGVPDTGTLTADMNNAGNFYIGKRTDGWHFDGSIDEVRVYNRALGEDEIRLLYNQKKPVLEMNFDEGSGTLAHDGSFNNNDGTVSGATWAEGKSGAALSFDGTDDYVYTPNSPTFKLQEYTFSVWINAVDFNQYRGILETDLIPYTSSDTIKSRLMTFGANEVRYHPNYTDGGSGAYVSFTDLPTNTWIHLEAAWDGAKAIGYLNGVNIGEIDYSTPSAYAYTPRVQVGRNADLARYFNGLIDSVRIYNYARTADEVLTDYNDGKAAHLGEGNQDLNRGLFGYWNMEEGGGQTVYDRSGNGNDGTLGYNTSVENYDPAFGSGHDSSGPNGMGVTFDGVDDVLGVDTAGGFNSPTGLSMGGWIKPSVASSAFSTGGWNYYSRGYWTSIPYEFGHWGNGTPVFKAYNAAGSNFSVAYAQPLSADTWYHIFASVDAGTGEMKIYINGTLANSNNSFTGSLPGITSMIIGGGSGGCDFPGTIDEFRVYGRALSADEVRLLYNRKKPVAEYKFDEGSGAAAHDESYGGNDGTVNGATWVDGRSGTALSFDGDADFVQSAAVAAITYNGIYTFSAWIYPTKDDVRGRCVFQDSKSASDRNGMNVYGGSARFGYYEGTSWHGASGPVSLNEWQHVEGVNNGGQLSIYIDGQLQSGTGDTYVSSTSGLYIGKNTLTEAGDFEGTIDSVRIYNYARTADEVLVDYNDGKAAHLGENRQDLNFGLVGYWNMEEGGGQTIYDRSGNNKDATLGSISETDGNDPIFGPGHDSSGPTGRGTVYDGTDDRIIVGSSLPLNPGSFTVTHWVKTTSSKGQMYTVANTGNSNGFRFGLGGGKIAFLIGDGTTYNESSSGIRILNDDEWHLITGVFDRSNLQFRAYADGVLDSTYTISSGYPGMSTAAPTIGYCLNSASAFVGSLDEIRIYNRALIEDEIRMLHNQKKPMLDMRFDEGAGATAYDESFNDHDGTINGATWVDGKSGTALSFDGVDDYVDAGDISSADWRGVSTSAWVYWTADGMNGYAGVYYKNTSNDLGRLLITNSGPLLVQNGNGNFNSTSNISKNVWTHVAYTYDQAAGQEYLYINGEPKGQKARTGNIVQNSTNLWVGFGYSAANNYMFPGLIDSFRVYNYARTADEIRADYNAGMAARLR